MSAAQVIQIKPDDLEVRATAAAAELSRLQTVAAEARSAAEQAEAIYTDAPSEATYTASARADRAATIARDASSAYHAKIRDLLDEAEQLRRRREYERLRSKLDWRRECAPQVDAIEATIRTLRTTLHQQLVDLDGALHAHRQAMMALSKVAPDGEHPLRAGRHLEKAVQEIRESLRASMDPLDHLHLQVFDSGGDRAKLELSFPRGAE